MRVVELVDEGCSSNKKLTFYVCYCSGRGRPEFLEGQPYNVAVFLPKWFYEELRLFFGISKNDLPEYIRACIEKISGSFGHYEIFYDGAVWLKEAELVKEEKREDSKFYDCCFCPLAPKNHYYLCRRRLRTPIDEYISSVIDRVQRLWKFYTSRKVIKHDVIKVTIECKVNITELKGNRVEILKKEIERDFCL